MNKDAEKQNRRAFKQARREAKKLGGTVCAVKKDDGTIEYFVMPVGASDTQVAARAYEIRNGMPMGPWERMMVRKSQELRSA